MSKMFESMRERKNSMSKMFECTNENSMLKNFEEQTNLFSPQFFSYDRKSNKPRFSLCFLSNIRVVE